MPEREVLEVDVLIVGGGPAGLAAAYHLRQLNGDVSIAVLEKGKEIGAHTISGAVMDPRGIQELMPDWKEKGAHRAASRRGPRSLSHRRSQI